MSTAVQICLFIDVLFCIATAFIAFTKGRGPLACASAGDLRALSEVRADLFHRERVRRLVPLLRVRSRRTGRLVTPFIAWLELVPFRVRALFGFWPAAFLICYAIWSRGVSARTHRPKGFWRQLFFLLAARLGTGLR